MHDEVDLARKERREADEEEQEHDAHEPHGLLDARTALAKARHAAP